MSYQPARRRGLGWGFWRGLGYMSPVGFPDFNSFQTAAIASFAPCPPPYDPTCENPRDAAISSNLAEWSTNPRSCGVMVCNASGQPALMLNPAGSGVGYNTTSGFVPLATPAAVTAAPVVRSGGAAVSPRSPRPVPTAIQSASPASAPGGPAAPAAAPTPVQTQTAPVDTATTPITLPSDCAVGQSYVSPGKPYQYAPYAGQIAYQGACETIPAGTTTGAQTFSSLVASIPVWGWGVAVVGVILLTRGGKR